jgi:hypothetical protein
MLATVWGKYALNCCNKISRDSLHLFIYQPRPSYPTNYIADKRGYAPLFQRPMIANIMALDEARRCWVKSGW